MHKSLIFTGGAAELPYAEWPFNPPPPPTLYPSIVFAEEYLCESERIWNGPDMRPFQILFNPSQIIRASDDATICIYVEIDLLSMHCT